MSVQLVFSISTDYTDLDSVVINPIQHDLTSEVAPATPVCHASHLYVTNVGDETALNIGFFIRPVGTEISPTALSEYSTILGWTADGSEYGVYTVQGDDEIADYLDSGGEEYLCSYSNPAQQHTYVNGSSIDNRIVLKDCDGVAGDRIMPISSGGTQAELYVLIKIPNSESAGVYRFLHQLYYEETL